MVEYILSNEPAIRLTVFMVILISMMGLEFLIPRKTRVMTRKRRWPTNLAIIVIDSMFVRLIFPIVAVGVAIFAETHRIGLFNLIDLPYWFECLLAIILLDMMIYWQHVASHHIPVLWQLHKVHHADRDIDVTTGSRFHPVEIGLSMMFKMLLVLLLGPAAVAVILFELILNGSALFNHSNIKIPKDLDRLLRLFIVTPDMHRVHHSIVMTETNSNYGFSLSIWDRLFRSYISQPEKGHDNMIIGLSDYQTTGPGSLSWSMVLPFKNSKKLENWF